MPTKPPAPASWPDALPLWQQRFERHAQRHPGLPWAVVAARLQQQSAAAHSLLQMELTGGEPDVIQVDATTGACWWVDCAPESPAGRRSLCFSKAARLARKEYPPANSAEEMAAAMGLALLNEEQYRCLQVLGPFDQKTSSWIATPPDIQALGGALFADWRYGHVFVYHNGAQSYYAARGFRGGIWI
ncbi:MAG: DUF4256 domain-containing protein [Chitinophagaceae bacterium]|nr:DUF4256 domain-containing protein [Chitinophagaceae bacterium]